MKPSVTQLLDLLNKPALLKWANKIGLQGIAIDDYRKKAKSTGIDYHKQTENCLKHGEVFEDPLIQYHFEEFMRDKECLACEQSIEHELFKGRLDVRFLVKGTRFTCDFKPKTDVYLETILQLTAYRMVTGDDNIAVISLPDFTFRPIPVKSFVPYEEIIKALAVIWQAKQFIDGKTTEKRFEKPCASGWSQLELLKGA